MADQFRVNGNIHSWGSITVKVDGEKFYGFTSLSYGEKRERGWVYGMGKHQAPRGRTRGKYTPDNAKLKGPVSTVQALLAKLAAKSADGKSYGNVEFEVSAQYVEADDQPITITLPRAVIVSLADSAEEGTDAPATELELSHFPIRRNGLTLADGTAGLP